MEPSDEATSESTSEPTSWTTGRKVAIAIGAFALAALAFLAGSGWDVGVVTDWFSDEGSPTSGDWAIGEVVAADRDASSGVVVSVEVAPAFGSDGRCARVRLGDAVVEHWCVDGVLNPWDEPGFEIVRLEDYFGSFDEHAVRSGDRWVIALSGAVHPDVVRVTVHFGDGGQYSFVTRNPSGWFATVLPADVADPSVGDGTLVNRPVRLELLDAEGTRVASIDLPVGDAEIG